MESRTLRLLEFPKALQRLARFAISEPGVEACLDLAPLADPIHIERHCGLVREWLNDKGTSPSLSTFPSLEGLFRFLETPFGRLDVDGLWALRQVLRQVDSICHAVRVDKDVASDVTLLSEMVGELSFPKKTCSGLNRCLDDEGRFKDESSPALLSARGEIRRIHQKCTKKAKEFILERRLSPFLQEEFMTISSDRYVLPLKTSYKGKLPGIIHDYSQTGETCYFEPLFLVELNNSLQELKQEERQAEQELLEFLTGLAREEQPQLRQAYDLLVALDVLQAKVALAREMGGRPLEPESGAPLRLLNARHPLLALASEDVVPVDVELLPGQSALVISGGNAGGKTVCLKTLGLIALMAQAGVPVPVAEGSSLPWWDKIFVFIGDEQSLEDHVSTFTGQIHRLAQAWEEVDERSLVLLDEFGTGTDPSQGAALAQALVDALLEKGADVAAATHFPALKLYALTRKEIRSATVLFDPNSRRPLYRLGYDQAGASQALDVAREYGLPEEVLQRAEKFMLLDGSDTSALLERLNGLAVTRERELEKLEQEKVRLKERRTELTARFERDRTTLLEEMRGWSREVLKDWREGRLKHKQAMKELARGRQQLAAREKEERSAEERPEPSELKAGQVVEYAPWNKQAVVEEWDPKREMAKVDIGGVSMWVQPGDIRAGSEAPSTPCGSKQGHVSTVSGVSSNVSGNAGLSLDLRGLRADEALRELERFLDRALLGNCGEVEIIHGKGGGALRREVHMFLKDFPAVSSFSLAPEDRGGDGMTIVEIRD